MPRWTWQNNLLLFIHFCAFFLGFPCAVRTEIKHGHPPLQVCEANEQKLTFKNYLKAAFLALKMDSTFRFPASSTSNLSWNVGTSKILDPKQSDPKRAVRRQLKEWTPTVAPFTTSFGLGIPARPIVPRPSLISTKKLWLHNVPMKSMFRVI